MEKHTRAEQIASFALRDISGMLDEDMKAQLKKHLLDSIGSFILAFKNPPLQRLFDQVRQMGENGPCLTPIGRLAADRAAQLYTALIRQPDFMDNFLGKDATCHPSDNIGSLLAVSQMENADGKKFLEAMAISYQLQCRLIEEAPLMPLGFDHTSLLAYSIAAGVSRLCRMNHAQTSHAISICGASLHALAVSRASYTFEWKGFASALTALSCVNIALLCRKGMTGPLSVIEGPAGFEKTFGIKLDYDWDKEDLSLIRRCILKKYNSEVHTQPSLEALLELKQVQGFKGEEVECIFIKTFLTCYDIVGGGKYGNRIQVKTKEQADHSLPYLAAVAAIDGAVSPAQLLQERINRQDVQSLLTRVRINTVFPVHLPRKIADVIDPYTRVYPYKVPSKVTVRLRGGKEFSLKKDEYEGFFTKPMSLEKVEKKFRDITTGIISAQYQEKICSIIKNIETQGPVKLMETLAQALRDEKPPARELPRSLFPEDANPF